MTAKVGLMPIPEKALGEAMEKGGKKMKGTVQSFTVINRFGRNGHKGRNF